MKANNAAAIRAFRAFEKRAAENMDQTVRSVALTLFTAVVRRSPVDTGRFRGNWGVQADMTPQTSEITDKSGGKAIKQAQSELATKNAGDRIMLLNHLPYSLMLENGGYVSEGDSNKTTRDGYSIQAPYGMVKVTVMNFRAYVNRAVQGLRAR